MKAKAKQSRSEVIANFAERNHKDLSSSEVINRLSAVRSTIKENEAELDRLKARIAELRQRVETDSAVASGLERVLDSRR